jgi:predicted transcriptional regulator
MQKLLVWRHSRMPSFPNVAKGLSALLADQEIAQLELAEIVGVTRAAKSRYVSGDRKPWLVTVAWITH